MRAAKSCGSRPSGARTPAAAAARRRAPRAREGRCLVLFGCGGDLGGTLLERRLGGLERCFSDELGDDARRDRVAIDVVLELLLVVLVEDGASALARARDHLGGDLLGHLRVRGRIAILALVRPRG